MLAKRARAKARRTVEAEPPAASASSSSSADVKAPAVYTRQWVMENPEAFRRLSKPPEECPICLEPFDEGRRPLGPITGTSETRCRHYACRACWMQLAKRTKRPWRCPMCKEDVTDWIDSEVLVYRQPPQQTITAISNLLQDYLHETLELLIELEEWETASMGSDICRVLYAVSDYGDRIPGYV
jgi:hypothetical protein